MSRISLTRPHALGREGARRAAEEVAADLRRRFGVRAAWEGDVLRVTGKGVKGALTATDDLVHLDVSLGLALRPLRRSLEREIERELAVRLSPPAA